MLKQESMMYAPKKIDSRLPAALTDLHIHVGGAVAPHILFSIAHEQGLKLPVKNYWDFVDFITASKEKIHNLDDYLKIFKWTDKIQSSPAAIERSVYEIICKEYRSSRVEHIELRFNPMKRNHGGERDLDHIIHAALRGMDRAILEYGVKACLLFCLDREFDYDKNEIIVEKAIKYLHRGVLGIDLAGAEHANFEHHEDGIQAYQKLYQKAQSAGLKTTVHTGETLHTSAKGLKEVIRHLKPQRIGHGIQAAFDEEALRMLADTGTVLEICPTSNLHTRAVKDLQELGFILNRFKEYQVPFTLNTDGPYLLNTHLAQEAILLLDAGILSEEDVHTCFRVSKRASFIPS